MTKKIYRLIHTCFGWVGLLGDANGRICRLALPAATRDEAYCRLIKGTSELAIESDSDFDLIAEQIIRYFNGETINFNCEVDLSGQNEFDRLVWDATSEIGYGDVRSYAWVAERIGKVGAYRAVGQSLAKNPIPLIIPCHRVIKSNGELGGFSGGIDMKARLLELERAAVV